MRVPALWSLAGRKKGPKRDHRGTLVPHRSQKRPQMRPPRDFSPSLVAKTAPNATAEGLQVPAANKSGLYCSHSRTEVSRCGQFRALPSANANSGFPLRTFILVFVRNH